MRGTVLGIRHLSQSGDQEVGLGATPAQMFVRVSVLGSPDFRMDECAHWNVVSLFDSNLHEREGMAGAADGSGRSEVSATGQLLPVDLRLGAGATVDGHPTASQLAAVAGSDRWWAQPASRRDLSSVSAGLLLVRLPERMGHRYFVSQGGRSDTALPVVRSSRDDDVSQSGHPAFSRQEAD